MLFQFLSIAALLAALPTTLALSNVTTKALPADCSSYPLYNEKTSNADIEGWGDSSVYSYSYSPATGAVMRWGYVSSLTPYASLFRFIDVCR